MKLEKNSMYILGTYLIIFLFPSILISLIPSLAKSFVLINTIDYIAGAIILSIIASRAAEPNYIETNKKPWLNTIAWGLLGLVLVLVLQYIISIGTALFGLNPTSQNTSTLLGLAQMNPFFILAIAVGAPIMEELVFRKVLFGNLNKIFHWENSSVGITISAIISSLAFALLHNDGHLFLYSVMGLLFCWLYRKTGRIQTSMISHALMNSLIVLVTLFSH